MPADSMRFRLPAIMIVALCVITLPAVAIAASIATDGADVVVVEADESFHALGGDDTVTASNGEELLRGDEGNDTLIGSSSGADSLDGGPGNDTITLGSAGWIARGGDGNDTLSGPGMLFGDDGDDTLTVEPEFITNAGNGNDTVNGSAADDYLTGDNGNDSMYGNAGADHIRSGPGNDLAVGGAGSDSLWGDGGSDRLHGDAGNDRLNGDSGSDTLLGGRGFDILVGGSSIVFMDAARDNLRCGPGFDFASAGRGDTVRDCEVVLGQRHADRIARSVHRYMGTSGSDVIVVTRNNSYVEPGAGSDRVEIRAHNVVLNLGLRRGNQWRKDGASDDVTCHVGESTDHAIAYRDLRDPIASCSGLQMG